MFLGFMVVAVLTPEFWQVFICGLIPTMLRGRHGPPRYFTSQGNRFGEGICSWQKLVDWFPRVVVFMEAIKQA